MRPMLMKAGTKVAESAASRRSRGGGGEGPARGGAPFPAATTGFSRLRRPRIVGWYEPRSRSAMSPADSRNSVRSWPTQNPRPAPVTTTARTSSARASLYAALIARCIAALKALSTSGRLSVIVRTPPSRLVSTSAMSVRVSHLSTPERRSVPNGHGRGSDPHQWPRGTGLEHGMRLGSMTLSTGHGCAGQEEHRLPLPWPKRHRPRLGGASYARRMALEVSDAEALDAYSRAVTAVAERLPPPPPPPPGRPRGAGRAG